jgi:Gram-negative bacterial TonB protein C-terminal
MSAKWLLLLAGLALPARGADSEGVAVLLGQVQSAKLEYEHLGKQTGRSYEGVVRISVTKILDRSGIRFALDSPANRQLVLSVDEENKEPLDLRQGDSGIFVVEQLRGGKIRLRSVIYLTNRPNSHSGLFSDCLKGVDLARDSSTDPVWLSSPQLHKRAIHSQPMQVPGMMDGHMSGAVTLAVLIDQSGKLECAEVLNGHPIATGSAIEAVQHYRFQPYSANGHTHPVLGTLTLDYHFQR